MVCLCYGLIWNLARFQAARWLQSGPDNFKSGRIVLTDLKCSKISLAHRWIALNQSALTALTWTSLKVYGCRIKSVLAHCHTLVGILSHCRVALIATLHTKVDHVWTMCLMYTEKVYNPDSLKMVRTALKQSGSCKSVCNFNNKEQM